MLALEILLQVFGACHPKHVVLLFSLSKSSVIDPALDLLFWTEYYRFFVIPFYGKRYSVINYPNRNYSELAEKTVGYIGDPMYDHKRKMAQKHLERVLAVTDKREMLRQISLATIKELTHLILVNLASSTDQFCIESVARVKEIFRKKKKGFDRSVLFANIKGLEKEKTSSVMEQMEDQGLVKRTKSLDRIKKIGKETKEKKKRREEEEHDSNCFAVLLHVFFKRDYRGQTQAFERFPKKICNLPVILVERNILNKDAYDIQWSGIV